MKDCGRKGATRYRSRRPAGRQARAPELLLEVGHGLPGGHQLRRLDLLLHLHLHGDALVELGADDLLPGALLGERQPLARVREADAPLGLESLALLPLPLERVGALGAGVGGRARGFRSRGRRTAALGIGGARTGARTGARVRAGARAGGRRRHAAHGQVVVREDVLRRVLLRRVALLLLALLLLARRGVAEPLRGRAGRGEGERDYGQPDHPHSSTSSSSTQKRLARERVITAFCVNARGSANSASASSCRWM